MAGREKAARVASTRPGKVEKLRRAALARLDAIVRRAGKAARSRRQSRRITEACRATLADRVQRGRTLLEAFGF